MPDRPNTRRTGQAIGVAAAGVTVASVAAFFAARSETLTRPAFSALALGLFGTVYAVSGAYSWWRRPRNRFGLVMAGAALVAGAGALATSSGDLSYPLGRAVVAALVVYIVYVLLCYPSGRLMGRPERTLIVAFTGVSAVLWAIALLVLDRLPSTGPTFDCGGGCPENGFDLGLVSGRAERITAYAIDGLTVAALALMCAVLIGKLRAPSNLQRRALAPLAGVAVVWAAGWSAFVLLNEGGHTGANHVLIPIVGVASLAVPAAMVLGQWRGRMFATYGLVDFAADLGSQPLTAPVAEALMRKAVGDPGLLFLVRSPDGDGYVRVDGARAELPAGPGTRLVTVARNGGGPDAAVSFDSHLADSDPIVEGLAKVALLMLENDRLVRDLGDSRTRIASEAAAERLRLERDLHDGAQQRLLALKLELAALQARANGNGGELEAAMAHADAAIDDIRLLSQGIYPAALLERGLGAALRSVAGTAAVPVRLDDGGVGRSAPAVEYAVYLTVCEAIQNAVKHGGPDVRVVVTLAPAGAELAFSVADDGAGFDARQTMGAGGLLNMADRIGSVGGTLSVTSRPGAGVTVHGSVPWVPVAIAT